MSSHSPLLDKNLHTHHSPRSVRGSVEPFSNTIFPSQPVVHSVAKLNAVGNAGANRLFPERPFLNTKSNSRHFALPGKSQAALLPETASVTNGRLVKSLNELPSAGNVPSSSPNDTRISLVASARTGRKQGGSANQVYPQTPPLQRQFCGSSGNDVTSFHDTKESSLMKDRLKDYGHPIKGPIMLQMVFHYLYFIVILASAYCLGWAGQIRFYIVLFYFNVSVFALQFSRICYTFHPNSVFPFYSSLVPFSVMCVIARESHMIIMVLWYVSWLVIHLQSGHSKLQRHLIIYTVLFLLDYAVCIAVMVNVYRDGCTGLFCGVSLRPPIDVTNEVVLGLACLMVITGMVMFERFVKMNALTLLEREQTMNTLYRTNQELKRELCKAKLDTEVDLDSPISKVISMLKRIRESVETDEATNKTLGMIIHILASDHLFMPNLSDKPVDIDVHRWLNNLLLSQTNINHPNKASNLKSPSNPKSEFRFSSFSLNASLGVTSADSLLVLGDLPASQEDAVWEYLEGIEDPAFDIFELNRLTNGHPLYYIGVAVFQRCDFFDKFQVPDQVFRSWLLKIESGYKTTNPYHNALHAADVTHAMHFYLTRQKLWTTLTPEEQFSAVIAAIIHDYMHPGLNNSYLINTMSPLSLLYNDASILEHYHCASAFELMAKDQYNILAKLENEDRKYVRENVISMVMSTDMAQHFEWVGKFTNKMSGNGFDMDKTLDRRMVLNFAMKCADVNNASKPLELCVQWTNLIMEEFYRQGDEEKARNMPVSMFMNRSGTDVPKCQIGFIDFIIAPLFDCFNTFMNTELQILVDNIANNKNHWKTKAESNPLSPATINVPTTSSRRGSAKLTTTSTTTTEENKEGAPTTTMDSPFLTVGALLQANNPLAETRSFRFAASRDRR